MWAWTRTIDQSQDSQPASIDWNESYGGSLADYEPPDADLLEIIDGLEPGRALDVGCGAGGLVVALADRGWQVTGIDIADRAIEAARLILEDRGVTAELIHADAAVWRPDHRYDLIVSSFALPDRPARTEVLRMIRDATSPGGSVALKDFDSSMKRFGFFAEFDLVTIEELTAAFEGFETVRAEDSRYTGPPPRQRRQRHGGRLDSRPYPRQGSGQNRRHRRRGKAGLIPAAVQSRWSPSAALAVRPAITPTTGA